MRILSFLLLLLPSLGYSAQVFKCVNADGSVAFQQTDCAKDADQDKVTLRDAKPPAGAQGIEGASLQSLVAEFPEVVASQEATDAVIARRNKLIAGGMAPEMALRLAAAEFAAKYRATNPSAATPPVRTAYDAPVPREPYRVQQSGSLPNPEGQSGSVLCTESSGREYVSDGPCKPVTRYRTESLTVLNPVTGQTSQGLVNVPRQEQPAGRSLTNREACKARLEQSENATYEKNKHKMLTGRSDPCS